MSLPVAILSYYEHPFAMQLIDACLKEGFTISRVIFVGSSKRKQDFEILRQRSPGISPIELSAFALSSDSVSVVESLDSPTAQDMFETVSDAVVLQGGGPFIPQGLIDRVPLGILNAHPGLLPEYRGASAVEWALHNDDPIGCTCHYITAKIDQGPIVCRSLMTVHKGDTYFDLRERMFFFQVKTMLQGLREISNGMRFEFALPQIERGQVWSRAGEDVIDSVIEKLREGRYACYTSSNLEINKTNGVAVEDSQGERQRGGGKHMPLL